MNLFKDPLKSEKSCLVPFDGSRPNFIYSHSTTVLYPRFFPFQTLYQDLRLRVRRVIRQYLPTTAVQPAKFCYFYGLVLRFLHSTVHITRRISPDFSSSAIAVLCLSATISPRYCIPTWNPAHCSTSRYCIS